MEVEITGTIHDIGAIYSKGNFRKREVIIAEDHGGSRGQWTEYIKVQFEQADVFRINSFHVGDNVTISCFIKGNKYEKDGETQYFTYFKATAVNASESLSPRSSGTSRAGISRSRQSRSNSDNKLPAQPSDTRMLDEDYNPLDDDMGTGRHPRYPVTTDAPEASDLPFDL